MSLIKINGIDLPAPSSCVVSLQDIVKAERNANATMIMELIGVKQKIELSWLVLTAAQASAVLTAIKPIFFTATYLEPESNTVLTKTFYKGDRALPMLFYNGGTPFYKDIKFNIIER